MRFIRQASALAARKDLRVQLWLEPAPRHEQNKNNWTKGIITTVIQLFNMLNMAKIA